jgi:hypothetical protein
MAGAVRRAFLLRVRYRFLRLGPRAYPDEAGTGLISAGQFRQLVWNAGGYGDLAGRRGPEDPLPQTGRRASL